MTKQRGPEPLHACPKARYKDGLDTAKSDVLADVLRQIGCTQAAEILTNLAAEGKGLGRKQYRPSEKQPAHLENKVQAAFYLTDMCSNASAK